MATTTSPVRLDARLDAEPGRGLWLVKWILLVPHLIVLFFLWVAFPVLTFVALVAILVTGRYPRALFEFNVGVLRWTWRVWFYGYGALGTDRYPPFSLDEEPGYPATLDVAYPERLSRGLALVKWWLLAVPHYLVVSFFVGGGGYVLWQYGDRWVGFDGGLVTLLSLFAGVFLLFTGRYPRGIFHFVVGMNRWVLRVAAYAALMTDEYPPFRLDTGGTDPATPHPDADADEARGERESAPQTPTPNAASGGAGWPAGRVVGVVVGVLVLLLGIGGTVGGGTLLWLDGQRDSAGYLATPVERFTDGGYALRFDAGEITPVDDDWPGLDEILGDVRIRASGSDGTTIFAGIARTSDVDAYLDDVPHGRFDDRRYGRHAAARMHTRPPAAPASVDFWDASATGNGTVTLDWVPQPGDWSLVVMDAAATPDVTADIAFAATAPSLRPIAIGVLVGGIVAFLAGGALIVIVARARPRRS